LDKKYETAIFGGGCFWCTETIFSKLRGVIKVTPGYAGGKTQYPSYMKVCSGTTGHAEVIKIEYDPSIIKYADLLDVFFHTHDPTTINKQGNDTGEQYRSIILYENQQHREQAEEYIRGLNAESVFANTIVTQVRPLTDFFPAESYHRNYYETNTGQPYCQAVISPKLAKFRNKFKNLLASPD